MTTSGHNEESVSLVVPGRNVAKTIRACLDSVVPLLGTDGLEELIFVDDASTDETASIVRGYADVKLVRGDGGGRGAARNIGWRAASGAWIWFVDADCVVHPDALQQLVPHLQTESVAGVGGSYDNLQPESLLSSLIHEEIVTRHLAMPVDVDFLATFNVLYRRNVLEEVGGFAHAARGQDIELAYRIREAGYGLRFERNSQVGHFHPTRLNQYLWTQGRHGYYRVWMYLLHPARVTGDSYSGWMDHVQPVLAMLLVPLLGLLCLRQTMWIPCVVLALLGLAQLPMAWSMLRRTRQLRYVCFVGLGFLRAFYRGAGMLLGIVRACVGVEAATLSGGHHPALSNLVLALRKRFSS